MPETEAGPSAALAEELQGRLPLDPGRPLHLLFAFGGTADLGVHEARVREAYERMLGGLLGRRGDLIVVDGATATGHIAVLQEVLEGMASGSPGGSEAGLRSFGLTSAAALRQVGGGPRRGRSTEEPDMPVVGDGCDLSGAHLFNLVLDTPRRNADWGYETAFFFEAMETLCRGFREAGCTQPLDLTVSLMNGGVVTAKEFAFAALGLPDLAARHAASVGLCVHAGTGRLAEVLTAAHAERRVLLVELGGPEVVVELRFTYDHLLAQVLKGAGTDPGAERLRSARPLSRRDRAWLHRWSTAGGSARCPLRVDHVLHQGG